MSMDQNEKPVWATEFILDLEKRGRRESTVKRYQYDLEDYLAWIRVNEYSYEDPEVLKTDFIQTYLNYLMEERSYSFRTLKRVYSVLKQYHQYLVLMKRIPHNPVASITLDRLVEDAFTEDMFITEDERQRLIETVPTETGLTENQLKAHPYLSKRNLGILTLLLDHGLTLHEVSAIEMRHLSFIQHELKIEPGVAEPERVIQLTKEQSEMLYHYYESIPAAVRPAQYSADPFFVAFDFKRLTYRWNYEENRPKRLTEIAIQKMIRQEVKRAGLRKGISSQHFRRTAIYEGLKANHDIQDVQYRFGLKTPLTLKRYLAYLEKDRISTS
ncbi:tyrosine-type recombinase/integrase [Pseudalkalibacillus sp. SCS-8]|uniref:tyrosine-type recombinase/integrase n=1 Tax=Pseudalkalibacillus nanhaiensis TaxID=3115291 RepID=UPI0032DA8235